jgi:hypothetical protein
MTAVASPFAPVVAGCYSVEESSLLIQAVPWVQFGVKSKYPRDQHFNTLRHRYVVIHAVPTAMFLVGCSINTSSINPYMKRRKPQSLLSYVF